MSIQCVPSHSHGSTENRNRCNICGWEKVNGRFIYQSLWIILTSLFIQVGPQHNQTGAALFSRACIWLQLNRIIIIIISIPVKHLNSSVTTLINYKMIFKIFQAVLFFCISSVLALKWRNCYQFSVDCIDRVHSAYS